MVRKYRNPKKKKKTYYYTEWDYCLHCHFIQHYDEYKVVVETTAERAVRLERKRQKKKVPRMSYADYITSSYWLSRKSSYFATHGGKRCAVCDKKYGVTLHHTYYNPQQFGKEPDSHLIPLCRNHHHEFHQHYPTKKDMRKESLEYVRNARQLFTSNIDDLSWI